MEDIKNGIKHLFYIFGHPFDGFWTLKSEKKGNVKTALLFLCLLMLTTVLRIVSSEYLFLSVTMSTFSPWLLFLAVLLLVFLYCISNWVLTTLLDGSGNITYIFISAMYSITPIIIVNVPALILSYALVIEEAAYITALNVFAAIWSLFLILIANSQIHEYSMLKSIATFIGTVIVMLLIAVLAVLFFNLVQQVYVWAASIVKEVVFRL